jgi:hypothetical protein
MSNDDGNSRDSAHRYADLAARVLVPARRIARDVPAPEERERAIAALAGALATRPARVTRRRIVAGLGAAAVAVVALGLVQLGREGRVTARLNGGPMLAVGAVVRANPEQSVSLALSTGTRLRLLDAGRVTLAELGPRQRFVLDAGRLWAKVAPLARDHRFVITTPDAEIVVRGTAFEVAVLPEHPPCGGVTQVKVTEGLVTVRRGNQLWQVAAGRSWPEACAPASPPSSAKAVPSAAGMGDSAAKADLVEKADALAKAGSPPPRTRPLVPRPIASASSSSLLEQNDLFAAAMGARRRGDAAAARRTLDDLLARFPFGALADSARDELTALQRPSARAADQRP